jgi:hypothetical protein
MKINHKQLISQIKLDFKINIIHIIYILVILIYIKY